MGFRHRPSGANPVLGWIATALIGVVLVTLLLIALRELGGVFAARPARRAPPGGRGRAHGDDVKRRARRDRAARYALRGGPSCASVAKRLSRHRDEVFDAESLFALAEDRLMAPLDAAATREVEVAARQVATVTALVPLAFADVIAALTANLRMIRRIAEVYGGRAGTLGRGG
jgi:putative membrane protein